MKYYSPLPLIALLTVSLASPQSNIPTSKTGTKKAVSGKAVSGKAASGKASSGKAVSHKAVSGKAASGKAVSGKAVSTRKGQSAKRRSAPAASRQAAPTPERYREIQQALVDKGYLKSEPNGVWDDRSADALRQFQTDRQLSPTGKLSSASLIGLGLGPKTAAAETEEAPTTPGQTPGSTPEN